MTWDLQLNVIPSVVGLDVTGEATKSLFELVDLGHGMIGVTRYKFKP